MKAIDVKSAPEAGMRRLEPGAEARGTRVVRGLLVATEPLLGLAEVSRVAVLLAIPAAAEASYPKAALPPSLTLSVPAVPSSPSTFAILGFEPAF